MKERPKLHFCILFALAVGLFLGGCATKFNNVAPPDDFIQQKNASIGLIWTSVSTVYHPAGPEYTAKHYMLGQQGLLDSMVAMAFSDKLGKALSEVKLKDLMLEHYFSVFQRAFESHNFTVKIDSEPYCYKKFRLSTNEYCTNPLAVKTMELKKVGDSPTELPIGYYKYDYKPVIEKLGVDYLLVIDLIMHGTGRTYFGMVPTSPPKGYTQLIASLVDAKSEEVISQHISSVVETVQGEWDEPPAYANLMKASKASFETAINEVFIDIFKQAP